MRQQEPVRSVTLCPLPEKAYLSCSKIVLKVCHRRPAPQARESLARAQGSEKHLPGRAAAQLQHFVHVDPGHGTLQTAAVMVRWLYGNGTLLVL